MNSQSIKNTLRELEGQRDLILMAIASLRAIEAEKPPVLVKSGGQTVIGAAITHLRKVGKPQTTAQLRQAIREAGVSATRGSIQTILGKQGRLKKDLINKSRGMWTLK